MIEMREMTKSQLTLLFLTFFSLALFSSCQTAPPVKLTPVHGADPGDYLVVSDEDLYKDKGITPQNVGFAVYDLDEQLLKTENNPTRAFIPASVQKAATALFALDTLGPKYHFKTTLAYVGKIHDGTLDGDLYLRGTGDPFFTAADLMRLAEQLRDRGIRYVSGHFYYDENTLAHSSAVSPYPVFGEDSYNPGVSALSLDFNESVVEKSDTRVYSIPELPHHPLEAPRPGSFPVQDPGLYTAEMFSKFCDLSGVELPLAKPGELPARAHVIAEHESFELIKLISKLSCSAITCARADQAHRDEPRVQQQSHERADPALGRAKARGTRRHFERSSGPSHDLAQKENPVH
jgi:D-alanyl-D-alanine carboxypeptidase